MPDRYQPLRDAIAAGPTKGPWRVSAGVVDNPRLIVEDDIGLAVCAMSLRGVHGDRRKMEANADFIAAADPDTIRALLEERDALREALRWYASMSKRMGNASIAGDSQAILALMKDVAVDYGGRARAALADGEGN